MIGRGRRCKIFCTSISSWWRLEAIDLEILLSFLRKTGNTASVCVRVFCLVIFNKNSSPVLVGGFVHVAIDGKQLQQQLVCLFVCLLASSFLLCLFESVKTIKHTHIYTILNSVFFLYPFFCLLRFFCLLHCHKRR